MDLNLQATAPATSGRNSASEKQSETTASSDFSRMLARQFGGSKEKIPQRELPEMGRKNDVRDQTKYESSTTDRMKQEASSSMENATKATSGPQENDAAAPGLAVPEDPMTGVSLALASLPGFLSTVDPMGNLNFTDPTFAGLEVVPADVRANLASQIAARFTTNQGIQTLTLKLDPEHLGKVDVRMRAEGDRLSVRIVAANREAESALRDNLKDLTDAIRDKTGKYQQVDVRVELKSQDDQGSQGTKQGKGDGDHRRSDGEDTQGNQGNSEGDPKQESDDEASMFEPRTQGG